MSPTILILLIILVPIVVLMVLRINAALVFLSLCLGNILVQYVATDANAFMTLFSATDKASSIAVGNNLIKIALLAFPPLLTGLFMIKTVRGARLFLNILPAAGVGILGGLLIVPLLTPQLSRSIVSSSLWIQAQQAQSLIVGASALGSLLVLWLQRPKTGGHDEHHA